MENGLNKVIKILEIGNDELEIDKVVILYEFVEQALMTYINEATIPTQLRWIVNEATIQRYQMLGTEHLQSEGIDVISSTFRESDVLTQYRSYLDSYIENVEEKKTNLKKVRMI